MKLQIDFSFCGNCLGQEKIEDLIYYWEFRVIETIDLISSNSIPRIKKKMLIE